MGKLDKQFYILIGTLNFNNIYAQQKYPEINFKRKHVQIIKDEPIKLFQKNISSKKTKIRKMYIVKDLLFSMNDSD